MINKKKREASAPRFFLLLLLDERKIVLVFGAVCAGIIGLAGKVRNALVRLADIAQRARAGNAAAGTCHALEQVAVVFSGLGHEQQLAALVKTAALATLTSRSGSMDFIALTTACATPPDTANILASLPDCFKGSASDMGMHSLSIPLAAHMPGTSSKVRTKSTSLRTVLRLASSFLASHGPTKTTLQPGCCFLTKRAVSTMGVIATDIFCLNSGKSFLTMSLQLGQQEVTMNECFAGTSSRKSAASCMKKLHRSNKSNKY